MRKNLLVLEAAFRIEIEKEIDRLELVLPAQFQRVSIGIEQQRAGGQTLEDAAAEILDRHGHAAVDLGRFQPIAKMQAAKIDPPVGRSAGNSCDRSR